MCIVPMNTLRPICVLPWRSSPGTVRFAGVSMKSLCFAQKAWRPFLRRLQSKKRQIHSCVVLKLRSSMLHGNEEAKETMRSRCFQRYESGKTVFDALSSRIRGRSVALGCAGVFTCQAGQVTRFRKRGCGQRALPCTRQDLLRRQCPADWSQAWQRQKQCQSWR